MFKSIRPKSPAFSLGSSLLIIDDDLTGFNCDAVDGHAAFEQRHGNVVAHYGKFDFQGLGAHGLARQFIEFKPYNCAAPPCLSSAAGLG